MQKKVKWRFSPCRSYEIKVIYSAMALIEPAMKSSDQKFGDRFDSLTRWLLRNDNSDNAETILVNECTFKIWSGFFKNKSGYI